MRHSLSQGVLSATLPAALWAALLAPDVATAADPTATAHQPMPDQSQPIAAGAAALPPQSDHDPDHDHDHEQDGDPGTGGASRFFDPRLSIILDGNFYQDGIGGEGSVLVGEAYQPFQGLSHDHAADAALASDAHAHGTARNGFNFRSAELVFDTTLGPYLETRAYLMVDGTGETDLEELWLQTRGLPFGLRLKGGRFLSDFGYVNRQHPHEWDFVDQNLPYLNLLGPHGLQDQGVQLTWQPELPSHSVVGHLRLGAELAQGNQEVFGATLDRAEQQAQALNDTVNGPRLWTAFAKVGPDLGEHDSLQFGLSYAHNRQHQAVVPYSVPASQAPVVEEHHHEESPLETDAAAVVIPHHATTEEATVPVQTIGLEGSAGLWGLDLVYRHAGQGAEGQGDFKFQAEYLRSIKDLSIRASPDPVLLGQNVTLTTDGLYAQALFGFAPRWTAGLRYDVLGLTNQAQGGGMGASFGSSERWTIDVAWRPWKYSTLRAQYAWNDILIAPGERERFDAFYLQLLLEFGTHGGHTH